MVTPQTPAKTPEPNHQTPEQLVIAKLAGRLGQATVAIYGAASPEEASTHRAEVSRIRRAIEVIQGIPPRRTRQRR